MPAILSWAACAVYKDVARNTWLGLFILPQDKTFQCEEFREAELVIDLGGMAVAILGSLPEFAAIGAAGKHGPVFLRLVTKNRDLLFLQIFGAERHHPIDFMRLPFLPGSAVEPDFEVEALLANLPD